MYIPKDFQQHDPEAIKGFIKQNGFGIIVSQKEGHLLATHIPFEFSEDESKLISHVSLANPQWKDFADMAGEVLVIFSGPHAYVSSSWYNHINTPTWNYIAVHVYGKIRLVDKESLQHSLRSLLDKYEKNSVNPVTMESLTPDYVKKNITGAVGFEIEITKIEAAFKLSQNRDDENYKNVITELKKQDEDGARQIAAAMKKNRCPFN
jgi:transcriptional regulator